MACRLSSDIRFRGRIVRGEKAIGYEDETFVISIPRTVVDIGNRISRSFSVIDRQFG
jgi:hypothetical protein